MSEQIKPLSMKHYGVSPWEINVITSILDKRFLTEDEEKLPIGVKSVIYNFDQEAARWRLNTVFTDEKKFVNTEKGWKLTT